MHETFKSKRYEPVIVDPDNMNMSHGLILWLVGKDKRILEIGTSTGYISRIFKQNGNSVTGIEVDAEAGEAARQYCERMIIGDIEAIDLNAHLKEADYDAIVLGDVLEHLKAPWVLLEKLKRYLKEGGFVVVSLPNVCHVDVLLNLMRGEFKYTPVGLLDFTHLRFFGHKNMVELFARCGYAVAGVHKVTVPVGHTELGVAPETVHDDLLAFMRSIPDADVYQYVFKLVPANAPVAIAGPGRPIKPLFQDMVEAIVRRRLESIAREHERETGELNADRQKAYEKISALEQELAEIKHGVIWRLFMGYHNVFVQTLMPPGTRRRKAYNGAIACGRALVDKMARPNGPFKKFKAEE